MRAIAIFLALSASWTAAAEPASEQPVPVHVAHLSQHVRERVQAHAEQGITSLARYLEISRTVHQLRLMDVILGIDSAGFAVVDADAIDREIVRRLRERDRVPR
jgi:hypothetical protein